MTRHRITWFVLADGSRARVLTAREEESGYDVVAEYEAAEARVPSRDIVSDRPGRSQESAYSGRHAIEPRQDAHRARKDAFAGEVASKLNEANARGAFNALVLYAAPHTLAALRAALDEATRAKVKAEFPKDLTKIPVSELPRHFAERA
jgi:protein required for attachment to host cells